jgi:hypothetical protein
MQNSVLKFLSILFLLICVVSQSLRGQAHLQHADSLFQQKRYIQSFEVYQTIFNQHQYSPAMLLKMAYIQEGLNHIAQSVYYLNLYYLETQDEAALVKLEEVAYKYRLEGYATSEFDNIFALYEKYRPTITLGIASIVVLMLAVVLVQRFRYHSQPIGSWVILLLFSIVFLAHLNFSVGHSNAIISKSNTYLMEGPSGGASVVSIVRDGHRVKIMGQKDVWTKVQWGDKEVFVKRTSLLPITL